MSAATKSPTRRVKDSPFSGTLDNAAAEIAEERLRSLREDGSRIKHGWPAPLRQRPPLPGADRWQYASNYKLVDHAYTIRDKDGRRRLCAEPYGLNEEDLEDLAALNAGGEWSAYVGQFPIYYPGHTTQIVYVRRKT
jgi:hypothetical protein